MNEQRQDDQLEREYNNSVSIQDVALRTSREQWTIETGGERASGRSVLAVWHDYWWVGFLWKFGWNAIPQRNKQGENAKGWINIFGEKCDPSQRNPLTRKMHFSAYLRVCLSLFLSSLVPPPFLSLYFLSSSLSQSRSRFTSCVSSTSVSLLTALFETLP